MDKIKTVLGDIWGWVVGAAVLLVGMFVYGEIRERQGAKKAKFRAAKSKLNKQKATREKVIQSGRGDIDRARSELESLERRERELNENIAKLEANNEDDKRAIREASADELADIANDIIGRAS